LKSISSLFSVAMVSPFYVTKT